MAKPRTVLLPPVVSDFAKETKTVFWKQILPLKKIQYTRTDGVRDEIDFTAKYFKRLDLAFRENALDQVPFVLADRNNAHTMDPERVRGKLTDTKIIVDGPNPGYYGRIEFPTSKAAKAVVNNPELGVSARIREGYETADGTKYPAAMIHVLGTLDPQVGGMSSWQQTDLSQYGDNVLDLSNSSFSEREPMPKSKEASKLFTDEDGKPRAAESFTDAEMADMDDETLDAFLNAYFPGWDSVDPDEDDDDSDEDEDDDSDDEDEDDDSDDTEGEELVGATAELSRKAKRDIELANANADAANKRTRDLARRLAEAEWDKFRTVELSNGVPPYLLDLAEPILNRADDLVIDLSNSGEENIPVHEIVRQMIEDSRGMIDLSNEAGHDGQWDGQGTDPDAAALAAWEDLSPSKKG